MKSLPITLTQVNIITIAIRIVTRNCSRGLNRKAEQSIYSLRIAPHLNIFPLSKNTNRRTLNTIFEEKAATDKEIALD